jgi:hypothetical protein
MDEKEFVIRSVNLNQSHNLDIALMFLLLKAYILMVARFPRRENETLLRRLFPLPASIIEILAVVSILVLLQQTSTSSISSFLSSLAISQSAYANHGQEAVLSIDNSTFTPLSLGGGNQVKVLASYTVQNSSIVGQTINAVMKLYASDGTLIKTSSYPSGFIAQNTNSTAELKSTIEDPSIQVIIANLTLTNSAKTQELSNEVSTRVNLQGASLTPTTNTTAIQEEETDVEPPQVPVSPPQQPLSPQPTAPQPSEEEGIQEENATQPTPGPEAEAPGVIPPFG